MPKFLDFKFDIKTPQGQNPVAISEAEINQRLFENIVPMTRRMGEAYANNLKITLARVRAIATGGTLRSVRTQVSAGNASRGQIASRVTASRSIIFIQGGRKPGKAPIRFVGLGPRGGKRFEPVAGLIKWFLALNIRRAAWMPIARAIGRRGIKPREVQMRAVRATRPTWQGEIQLAMSKFTSSIFKGSTMPK